MHLTTMHKWINDVQPRAVVIDPISNFLAAGTTTEVKAMLIRLIDFLKGKQITTVFTNLTSGGGPTEQTEIGVSSLMDTWLLLRDLELGGERNRSLYILKSRGMSHSNQLREFLLTNQGVDLLDVYLGSEGVLTGSARLAQEAREKADVRGSAAGDRAEAAGTGTKETDTRRPDRRVASGVRVAGRGAWLGHQPTEGDGKRSCSRTAWRWGRAGKRTPTETKMRRQPFPRKANRTNKAMVDD